MQRFNESFWDAAQFPRNLLFHDTYDDSLRRYSKRLYENQERLFCEEAGTSVDFWQRDDQATVFRQESACNGSEMKLRLGAINRQNFKDPLCRFIFIHAPNSRARLKITREMLTSALTYHQVMPAYLDFIFPFGEQEYPQDFHFAGLRSETWLNELDSARAIPELGRSGRTLQLCYSLKSVESSKSERNCPWSVRQTAIYHSFDVITGRTVWMIVKGNQLISRRIISATQERERSDLRSFGSCSEAFTASLGSHLIFCDWAADNWRWYINFLEEELQRITRKTLQARIGRPQDPICRKIERSQTTPIVRRQSTILSFRKTPLEKARRVMSLKADGKSREAPIELQQNTPITQSKRPVDIVATEDFSFSEIQDVQRLEEKTNDAFSVLKTNIKILSKLKDYYQSVAALEDWPTEIELNCKRTSANFERRVSNIIDDLQMQETRLETLLRLLDDRKTLLYSILEYNNMEANKHLTQKSQQSADKMESITVQMHKIAVKTEKETISMRIITLVTLFFLPGTFISTLMSTDIIKFQPQRSFSMEALRLYLAICVPAMFITFLLSWIYYRIVCRKDRQSWEDSNIRCKA